MVRLVIKIVQALPDGSRCKTTFRTLDIAAPELEEMLSWTGYTTASVIGAEVISDATEPTDD